MLPSFGGYKMKSIIVQNEVEIKTVEFQFNGKTYNAAASLSVLSKLDKIPDDVSELDEFIKIITILINDSIDRDRIVKGEKGRRVTEEEVALFITQEMAPYYSGIIAETLGASFSAPEAEKDEDGEETVVTDEMLEAYGDEKNTEAG